MDIYIAQAKPYLDYIAVGLIWLVICVYMLLEKRRKAKEEQAFEVDPELSRQSKGRLSSLDAMAGLDTHAPDTTAAALPSDEPVPFKSIGDAGPAGPSPLSYDDPMTMPLTAENVYKAAPEEETDRSALLTQLHQW